MNIKSLQARLKQYSRKNGKTHQFLLIRYFQERLLYRLSLSDYKKHLLLKGGALAYVFSEEETRHTKDLDFLLTELEAEQENLKLIFQEISSIQYDDGVEFMSDDIHTEAIQKEGNYEGIRLKIMAHLGNIKQPIQVDIGVGDHVTSGPQEIEYPIILPDLAAPSLLAYSIETLVAEKFNAMIDLAESNSRLKDFYDVYKFLDTCDKEILKDAIHNTFQRRGTICTPVHPLFKIAFYSNTKRSKQWSIFLKKNQLSQIDFLLVHEKILEILAPIYKTLLKEI